MKWIVGSGWWIVLLALAVGCGKKGPPLPPFALIPDAVSALDARRAGDDVYLKLTLPKQNIDRSIPVAISRVEVYGYTGRTAPPRTRWVELGTLIATVPVARPPAPEEGENVAPVQRPDPDVPPDPTAAAAGTIITVHDALTADELVPGPSPFPELPRGEKSAAALAIAGAPEPMQPLRRFYTAIPFSPRGRPGPPGETVELALGAQPDPASGVQASYTDTAVTLTWEPSGGTLGYLLDQGALGPEEPPFGEFEETPVAAVSRTDVLPPGPTGYNVYRLVESDPLAPLPAVPSSPCNASMPAPLNAAPMTALTITDTVSLGRRHCYEVRAVRTSGTRSVESAGTAPLCFTPVDVFPPAPPRSVAAVPSESAITLIWEPNDEADIGGYMVLRGDAPGATLQALTPAPITDARFRDGSVKSGARYVYAVVAVDNRLPLPNVSAESERVEETAP